MKTYSEAERKKDLLFYCITLCISLGISAVAFSYPSSSSAFPRLLCVVLVGICAISAINTYAKKVSAKEKQQSISTALKNHKTPILFFIMIGLYIFALTHIGFFVSSCIFVLSSMYLLNYRNKLVMFIWSPMLCAIIWLIFGMFLNVPMPQGMLF